VLETESILKRHTDLVVHKTEDGYALYNYRTRQVHFLNHTAAFFYELCDGNHTIAEAISIFKQHFECSGNVYEMILDLVKKFKDEEIIG